ncbi:MAG: DUF421 domain-containing protein [Armatimonadetes bacterium]|nr:DUF421 domain-containing protein [Armatimonadota bacterium]MDE2207527.1 DUF421 domain-containing protein [Armatimonadota bacterium]
MIAGSINELLTVVGSTLVIYAVLIGLIRVLGRSITAQLGAVDLAVILVLGSAVETAMVHGDVSLPAGLECAATLLIANRIIAVLALRYPAARRLVSAGAVVLVRDGQPVEENLKRTGLTIDDVLQAIRERECDDLATVAYAVLEEDGEINVIESDAAVSAAEGTARRSGESAITE